MEIQYSGSGIIPSYVDMIYEGQRHSDALFFLQKMKEIFILETISSHKDTK